MQDHTDTLRPRTSLPAKRLWTVTRSSGTSLTYLLNLVPLLQQLLALLEELLPLMLCVDTLPGK